MRVLLKGRVVSVDARDDRLLQSHNWSLHKGRHTWYVSRLDYSSGYGRRVYLHRAILGASGKIKVDPRDGDGLNNCRDNLRRASNAQNHAAKMHRLERFASWYRGVYFHGQNKNWCAQIKVDYQKRHLGSFESESAAALAYNEAARAAFGEFAQLNLVDKPPAVC